MHAPVEARRDAREAARTAARTEAATDTRMAWQETVERTVTGLGYELVEIERAPRGLLRVFIDRVPGHAYEPSQAVQGAFVTVDDCERVTRQLQSVLEVEGFDYSRLEVSSPGLDRPLKRAADYERFAGQAVDVTLRAAFEGRKKYRGRLEPHEGGWRLVLDDDRTGQALDFVLDEVREARLVPVVNFKGRSAAVAPAGVAAVDADGGGQDEDGGRIQ
jgi:ribosome maturation factor RimP